MEGFTMAQTDTRSLQQLKLETEQARAGLTNTVEQLRASVTETASDLRQRIQPDAIKAEVSDYIKSRGEQLLNDITSAARRNPMQAVAVGASVAYPLLRLARTIPVPILMVGAGLFFAGSKTGQAITQKASDVASDLSDEVTNRARDLRDQIGESASAVKTYASEQLDRVSDAVSDGTDQVNRAADAAASNSEKLHQKASAFGGTVSDRATDLTDEGLCMASLAAAKVQEVASAATSVGRSAIGTATDAGLDAARAVPNKASHLTEHAGETIFRTIHQNPLLVAGVGLLVGGLIASALSRSDIEDDLVGDASTAVKSRAQSAAAQGFAAVRNAAGEIVDETTRQAEAEGLTSEGIGKAAQDLGQRMRRVAESAVTTAFEPEQKNYQSSNYGETDHG
jgi:hypothetical protein